MTLAQVVRVDVQQLEGCWFDSTLGVSPSKTSNPQIAPGELIGTLHGSQSPLVCECVYKRVNDRHRLYSALD